MKPHTCQFVQAVKLLSLPMGKMYKLGMYICASRGQRFFQRFSFNIQTIDKLNSEFELLLPTCTWNSSAPFSRSVRPFVYVKSIALIPIN